MKFKVLPSLRLKKRYIAFRMLSSGPVSKTNLKDALQASIRDWVGVKGLGESGFSLLRWNERTGEGIIRCGHLWVDDIKLAMALLHQIGDEKVILASYRVSGTLKGLEK